MRSSDETITLGTATPAVPPPTMAYQPSGSSIPALIRTASLLWRSPVVLLLLVLVALAAVELPSDVRAQSVANDVTLVSNVQQGSEEGLSINSRRAQVFRTGYNSTGYVISEVQVVSTDPEGDEFQVSICNTNSRRQPTTPCTGLNPPDSFAAGTLTFTAPSGLELDARAHYAVTMRTPNDSGDVAMSGTGSTDQDSSSLIGWTIRDRFHHRPSSSWNNASSNMAFRLAVKGRPKAVPGSPTSMNGSVGLLANTAHTFSVSDFPFTATTPNDALTGILIITLPGDGALTLSGSAVTAGQEIDVADIEAGDLVFTPDAGEVGDPYTAFVFRVKGASLTSTDAYDMTVNVHSPVSVPGVDPAVSSILIVSDPGPDQTYVTGNRMSVTLVFNESVTVDTANGTPRVTLDIGDQPRYAAYSGIGSSATALRFSYTALVGDHDDDGISLLANSLELNGGTIRATDNSAPAALAHAAMTFPTHKVDTQTFLVGNFNLPKGPPLTISADQSALIQLYYTNFLETTTTAFTLDVRTPSDTLEVTVTLYGQFIDSGEFEYKGSVTSAGLQTFTIADGPHPEWSTFSGDLFAEVTGKGPGTIKLEAVRTLEAEPGSLSDLDILFTDANVKHHIPRFRMEGHPEAVRELTDVVVVSSPADGVAYTAGEQIEMLFTFNDPVEIPDSTVATFWLGEGKEHRREAALIGNPLGYTSLFAYTVQPGDIDADGIYIGADPLGDNAGVDVHADDDPLVPADLSLPAKQLPAGQAVDGSRARACPEVLCSTMTVGRDGTSFGSDFISLQQYYPYEYLGRLNARTIAYGESVAAVRALISYPVSRSQPMYIAFVSDVPQSFLDRGALVLDGTRMILSEADSVFSHYVEWDDLELGWEDGDEVDLKLIETATASFDAATYQATEGDDVEVTVTLDEAFLETTVTLPITVTGGGGATEADYTLSTDELVFAPGDTSKTFTVTLVDDTRDDEGESLTLSLVDVHLLSGGTNETAVITIVDNDAPEVDFGASSYAVLEGGTVSVDVTLTSAPNSTVTIPVTHTPRGGAVAGDYDGVPQNVTFSAGDTSQSFTVSAMADGDDDAGESVLLGFGTPPAGVQQGTTRESTVHITDIAAPEVEVSFGQASYSADEGGTVDVTVTLSGDPERIVVIPIEATPQGGATDGDFSVPERVTFTSGQTSATLTVTAVNDTVDDDDESVLLGFGSLPAKVSEGSTNETTVSIADDDHPEVEVSFGQASYSADEGGTVDVTVTLNADPERTVEILITAVGEDGASDGDFSVPEKVTFTSGQTSTTLTFSAVDDTVDDDDESVRIGFGALPERVSRGMPGASSVAINDDDDPVVSVSFASSEYTVDEGGTGYVNVSLSADPERELEIPITTTRQGGASAADFSVSTRTVTFESGETLKTIDFTATQDSVDDDDESVILGFGVMPDARVSPGTTDEAVVSINDDDFPHVQVQFGQDTYLINEGQTINVTITLDADPERAVEIPITKTNRVMASDADYTVPGKVTFDAGETLKTIAFVATQDDIDDDEEEVKLEFGSRLPERITEGARDDTVVKIIDDDFPEVTVAFSESAYTVAEGASQVVTVTVDKDPERTIIIPINETLQGTGSAADYSGVPEHVTFTDGGTTSQTFTFAATQDFIDDDDEGVKLEFGTMPDERVTAGTTDELTISIADDDTADVVLSPTSLTLEEEDAAGAGYTVALATEPTVEVTVIVSGHAGTDLTLSGARLNNNTLTFTPHNWNTPRSISVTAAHDDDGVAESVTLAHAAAGAEYDDVDSDLPVTINDNDPLGIMLDPLSLAVEESDSADYSVRLATEPTQAVTVTIMDDGDSDLDHSETTLTFTDADWNVPQTVTLTALHDEDRDDDAEILTHTAAGGEYDPITQDLPVTIEDNTGDLRLMDGTLTDGAGNLCEGRLEIYYDGQWGTICDDYWTKPNADVACRALGFAGGSIEEGFSRKYRNFFPAGDRNQPIWLDDVQCDGGEAGLLGCPRRYDVGGHNCRHAEDVGLRCIKNDGPFIVDMEFNEPPGGDGSYDVGDTVEVTVVWSEAVTVTTTPNGHPALWLVYDYGGGNHRRAYYQDQGGPDSDRTVFTHTIEDFGNGTSFAHVAVGADSLFVVDPLSLSPPGSIVAAQGGIPAILGHRAYRSDGVKAYATDGGEPAVIERVPAISNPGRDGAFSPGETVEISFVFSKPVEVDETGGTPSVQFLLGDALREAQFDRGSGTLQLVFSYTLADGDGSHSSILLSPNALALNGGAIRDTDNGLDAAIAHEGTGIFFLDREAPTLQSAAVDGSTLTLAYSETLDNTASLSPADFAVTVNGSPRSVLGAGAGQSNVILFVSPAVVAGDTVTVSYTAPTDANAAKIQDESRNPAASFSGQAVTNNTASAANSPATGAPAITGTAQVGEALEADTSGIADSDGLTGVSYAYQWLADDVDIANATGRSYTLVEADEGKAIKLRVSFSDDAGNPEVLTSAATTAVAAAEVANSPATGAPAITGTAQVGEALEADTSAIADTDGLTNVSYAYQWLADDVDIANATASSFTLTTDEQGKAIKVRVSFSDDAGNPEVLTSTATTAVAAAEVANSPATGAPAVTGTAQVGEALEADTSGIADSDGLTGVSYAYQWLADDVDIGNATATSYTPVEADEGKTIKVRVSFTDDAGNPEVLTSAATAAVAAAPEPEPTPLTATVHDAPDSHDGSAGVFTFELRFSEAPRSFSYKVLRDDAFTVTGGAVTKARRPEREGETRNMRWEITVTPHGNGQVTVVLPPTTDCEAQGAICTADGRMLSGRLEFIVPGPEVRPSGSG